jgi:hypothetical protein
VSAYSLFSVVGVSRDPLERVYNSNNFAFVDIRAQTSKMMNRSVSSASRKAVRGMATGKDVRFGAEVSLKPSAFYDDVTCCDQRLRGT